MFYAYSRKLYGSPKDKFPDGVLTLRDLGHLLYEILTNIDEAQLGMHSDGFSEVRLSDQEVRVLAFHERLDDYLLDS